MEQLIAGAVVAIMGGVAATVGTLLIQTRERRASYQRLLYEERVKALGAIVAALGEVYDNVGRGLRDAAAADGLPIGQDARRRVRMAMVEPWNVFATTARKWTHVVPQEMAQAMNEFEAAVFGLTGDPETATPAQRRYLASTEPVEDLRHTYIAGLDAIRACLGIDPLSDEIARMFNTTSPSAAKRGPRVP